MKYLYFAKLYDSCIIRVALPFEVNMEKYFRPDWVLLVGIVLLFAVLMLLARLFSRNYENRLKKASEDAAKELKHSLTSNIAHELKTPVSSIRGYLETLIENPDISEDRRNLFIDRSYAQSIRLSELIRDVAIITKLEESPEQFRIEPVDLCNIVTEVSDEFNEALQKENMRIYANVPDQTMIGRIFERFYSIPGKPGSTEGSGLGLSIVKNAVTFHKGTISASIPKEGGLRFDMDFQSVPSFR